MKFFDAVQMDSSSDYLAISRMFDHALLTPTLTTADLEAGIQLGLKYDVGSICILPYYLKVCSARLAGSSVKPSTVIGFPTGCQAASTKHAEAVQAIADGGQELDMVVNLSHVVSGNWSEVKTDILAVLQPAHAAKRQVKVIFENCFLTEEQKLILCEICSELNVDWVKTSTGFGLHGATLEDVRLMRDAVSANVQVKAAGGIRSMEDVLAYREAGATRIGTSKTAELLDEWRKRLGLEPLSAGQKSSQESSPAASNSPSTSY